MKTNESDPRWILVQQYAEGLATAEEVEKLEAELGSDPQFRSEFIAYLNLDAALEENLIEIAPSEPELTPIQPAHQLPSIIGVAATLAALAACVLFLINENTGRSVATIGEISPDARWLSPPVSTGISIAENHRIQLASGSVEIRFRSGALTRLHGPADFRILTDNSGFLSHGEAFSLANNEESKGFTIETHSGDFVDQGTEFLTSASVDGFSQLHVTSGAVDVEVPGLKRQRLRKGSGLGIEPGEVPVFIRIERGSETPAFQFPTIPPPGSDDFADRSKGDAVVNGWPTEGTGEETALSVNSGPFELLIDGRGQQGEDHPAESVFFRDGSNGLILIDLGTEVPVSRIHTYSWHRNFEDPDLRRRAVQRYTLWGCRETKPGSLPTSGGEGEWTRIARVNTDAFFQVKSEPDRPAQQACAIFSAEQAIGTFRYLLFEVSPTPMPDGFRPRHTFLGEIDVFTTSTTN